MYSLTELQRGAPIAKSSSDQQPFVHHSDARRATDMSEGSTNTEDYITCTDALSKRGIVAPTTSQIPGSNLIRNEIDVVLCFVM